MSFKTFAPNGLLFLAGKENTFMSLEIKNGKVFYQVGISIFSLYNKEKIRLNEFRLLDLKNENLIFSITLDMKRKNG